MIYRVEFGLDKEGSAPAAVEFMEADSVYHLVDLIKSQRLLGKRPIIYSINPFEPAKS